MDSMPSEPAVSDKATDTEIFLAIQAQQVKALDLLYDRYGRLVYSTAVRMLNNIEEAEEVTQETFLRLWQRSEIYQPGRGSLSGFLVMLARSRSLDLLRSRKSSHQKLQRIQTAATCVLNYTPPSRIRYRRRTFHICPPSPPTTFTRRKAAVRNRLL